MFSNPCRGGVFQQPVREPSGGLGHVGFQGSLVNKPDVGQQVTHEGLASRDPGMARLPDLRPLLLDGLKVFFLCVSPRLRSVRQTDTRWTVIWCSSAISRTRSSSVRSGLAAIRAAFQSSRRPSLPCPPPLPCARGSSPPVSRFSIIMSLTNFTDTRNRASATRCECPSPT